MKIIMTIYGLFDWFRRTLRNKIIAILLIAFGLIATKFTNNLTPIVLFGIFGLGYFFMPENVTKD